MAPLLMILGFIVTTTTAFTYLNPTTLSLQSTTRKIPTTFIISPFESHVLFMNRKETARDAIQEALEITRKYGASSPEAQVAWEIAEEVEDSVYSPCSKRCDPYGSYDPDMEDEECPL